MKFNEETKEAVFTSCCQGGIKREHYLYLYIDFKWWKLAFVVTDDFF